VTTFSERSSGTGCARRTPSRRHLGSKGQVSVFTPAPYADPNERVLTEYAEGYGVSMTDLGVDRLHLYLPTGHGVHVGDFNEVFRAAELEPAEWREDAYVLSTTPLTVDPAILAPCDWREHARSEPDVTPEP